MEKKHHDFVSFCEASISLDGSLEIKEIKSVSTTDLLKEDNWKRLISDKNYEIVNLVSFDKFIKVSRGIATGDNEYFLFNEEKRIKNNLSMEHFYQVICKAPYINKPFFTSTELEIIKKQNKDYLLFDGTLCSDDANAKYLEFGLNSGILDKYLVASRKVWYESEQKPIAPIWICGNSREKIKVVRNELGVRNLTTFHGVFVKKEYTKFIDVIFCYLLSNTSQRLLEMNKKEYAGGLNKFQPGDIQKSFTIDFEKMSNDDISLIKNCYNMMKRTNSISEEILLQLNLVFDRYL